MKVVSDLYTRLDFRKPRGKLVAYQTLLSGTYIVPDRRKNSGVN